MDEIVMPQVKTQLQEQVFKKVRIKWALVTRFHHLIGPVSGSQ
jgi:hypothetical protein